MDILSKVLWIWGICWIMYIRTLKYGYIIDDVDTVNAKIETPTIWHKIYQHFRGTKFSDNTLAHFFNVLIHTINCILIYLAFGHNDVSFLTALLFALNPVNNQVSMWLMGKYYGISTILLLLGYWILPLFPILYGLSFMFSVNCVMFPFIFLFREPHWMFLIIPLGLLITGKRFVKVIKDRFNNATDNDQKLGWNNVVVFLKTIGFYFWHCIFPVRIGMFHSYLSTYGMSEHETKQYSKIDRFFYLGIFLIIFALYLNFILPCEVSFGLIWFLLFISQWGNIFVMSHCISERYAYLANMGLMYVLANLIIGTPLVVVFITAYVVRLFYFMPAYKDMISYWKSNIDNFPDVALAYNQLGLAYIKFGNNGNAFDTWIAGVQIRPNDFRLNYNIGNFLVGSGNYDAAIPFIKKAEENIHKKSNFEFWTGQIDTLKKILKEKGKEV